jgi:hypothetical protein
MLPADIGIKGSNRLHIGLNISSRGNHRPEPSRLALIGEKAGNTISWGQPIDTKGVYNFDRNKKFLLEADAW